MIAVLTFPSTCSLSLLYVIPASMGVCVTRDISATWMFVDYSGCSSAPVQLLVLFIRFKCVWEMLEPTAWHHILFVTLEQSLVVNEKLPIVGLC